MGARWTRVPGELQRRVHRVGWASHTITLQTVILNVISTTATAVPERWVKCMQQVCEDSHGEARSCGLGAQELVPIKEIAGSASNVPDSD
jgi:hypothetical protein